MATKRIVPRATGEGGIGRTDKLMGPSFFQEFGNSSKIRTTEAAVTTTNATPTVLWSRVLSNNEVINVLAKVVAGDAAGAAGAAYHRTCLVRKPGAGTAVIAGSQVLSTDIETTATMNLTWAISGTDTLQLLATGLAATTLNWRAQVTVLSA